MLLHADLYRENILFDNARGVVFIDPLPMVGDPVFDWAFWTVYYDLERDPVDRLKLANQASGISSGELVPWCLTLCLDGLLYYRQVGDSRLGRMRDVMAAMAKEVR
ncbi:streptomycin 6-kinase [Sinosporangium album]|uniref:Streptomycin 6-kinase n=1 Tax=Sinosporangium album TaxID=504805 RepID=A0A1G8CAJ5_9ACTN|nr:streptomycin 6-kinase [Sinosporangium album]